MLSLQPFHLCMNRNIAIFVQTNTNYFETLIQFIRLSEMKTFVLRVQLLIPLLDFTS